MARAAHKLTAQELAAKAAVSKNTVASVEAGADAHGATLAAIERALTGDAVVFISENGGGPGVRRWIDGSPMFVMRRYPRARGAWRPARSLS
jgi:transcriptional regulator with XRE-family HTH domain